MSVIGNDEVWISKFLSHSGVCSRRDVKELVLQGRVTVNGEVIKEWTLHLPSCMICVCAPAVRDAKAVVVYNGAPDTQRLQDSASLTTERDRNRSETALQKGLRLPDEGRPCLPLEELEVLLQSFRSVPSSARDGPRGRRNEDLEPQVASLEDMDSLEEDWETGWALTLAVEAVELWETEAKAIGSEVEAENELLADRWEVGTEAVEGLRGDAYTVAEDLGTRELKKPDAILELFETMRKAVLLAEDAKFQVGLIKGVRRGVCSLLDYTGQCLPLARNRHTGLLMCCVSHFVENVANISLDVTPDVGISVALPAED
ncbi:S4 RNA-binding domain-containing protein [Durusdinium trenchii]|uniref:S4 RNA-binding domain-containing protein n=1 Tax=Durusdinium trenchii TaxID=1381693 RepID=A0ABP0JUV5_9DINO